MIDKNIVRNVYKKSNAKQRYLIETPYADEVVFSISNKFDLGIDLHKKLSQAISHIILGFYKVEDTVPLLQQELGIDPRTAALLGADVLDFLAPLSDPNWQPPVDENEVEEDEIGETEITDDLSPQAPHQVTTDPTDNNYQAPATNLPPLPTTAQTPNYPTTSETPVYQANNYPNPSYAVPPQTPNTPPVVQTPANPQNYTNYSPQPPAPTTNYRYQPTDTPTVNHQPPTPPYTPPTNPASPYDTPRPVPPPAPQAQPPHFHYEPVYQSTQPDPRAPLSEVPTYQPPNPVPPAPRAPLDPPRWETS